MVFVLTALINMRGVLAAIMKMSNLVAKSVIMLIALVSLDSGVATAQVTLAPLQEHEIRANMIGKLFTGEYPDGTQWAERFNSDLTTDYSVNGQIDKGIMSINGSIICFTYPQNPLQVGGCFEVWKRGPNCFDFYASDSSASLDQRRFGRAWQARGWVENKPGTCLSEEIS